MYVTHVLIQAKQMFCRKMYDALLTYSVLNGMHSAVIKHKSTATHSQLMCLIWVTIHVRACMGVSDVCGS